MVDCTMAEAVDERYDAHDGDGCAHSHPGCITLEQCHTYCRQTATEPFTPALMAMSGSGFFPSSNSNTSGTTFRRSWGGCKSAKDPTDYS